MTENRRRIEDLVLRIEGDFLEIAGLKLTLHDAQARFAADVDLCEAIFAALEEAGVLYQAGDGTFMRYFPCRKAA